MVIPAAASTSFSLSNKILISSSILSGAFPVFGSSPSRPARYSVLPDRIASLDGNCALRSPTLIAFRVGWIVTCDNAPRTVNIPPNTNTTTRKLIRRFILSLHSNSLPAMPRECNTQILLRQAARKELRSPGPLFISIDSRNSFGLERNQSHPNEVQRSEPHP